MRVASNGISAGNGGWGYECPQCRYLLVAMGPDRGHPVKAVASRAPASRLIGLDGMSPARQGLGKQVRSDCVAERSLPDTDRGTKPRRRAPARQRLSIQFV